MVYSMRGSAVRESLDVDRFGGCIVGYAMLYQNRTAGFMMRFGSIASRTACMVETSSGDL